LALHKKNMPLLFVRGFKYARKEGCTRIFFHRGHKVYRGKKKNNYSFK
jgi:hypothetical protein